MFQTEWEILIVDDEPDVFAVSRLALKNVKVYGVPLKLHYCASRTEAVDLISTKSDYAPALAVALIDVVMETDTAGLDLCRFIREERGNPFTQLFIRTGQPGTAPEREVIDRYEINGYFTKAEATEDKLYSMIKSGVRQYYWSILTKGVLFTMRNVTSALGSRPAIAAILQKLLDEAVHERSGEAVATYANVNFSYILENQVVASAGWSQSEALAARDRLDQQAGLPLSPSGKYVIDENKQLLVKVSPGQGIGHAYIVATLTFQVPEFIPAVLAEALASHATVWHASA
ncbi:MAG: response regulator receiver protein [Candidatus Eremiobacteraeota bacterium]|nr:response regulator receiver protein [Candidatus Eremiobacteraeota bacterium]MCW5872701.1 response regulator receiver protein [Candidatus Eremiobacteraeota bacterium]